MKAISLYQPWASLIAIGAKPYETRSWMPPRALIGQRIAIHASKLAIGDATFGVPENTLKLMRAHLENAGLHLGGLPKGVIVCTAILQSAERVDVASEFARLPPDLFGDYSIGRCVWWLRDVLPIAPPVPVRGRQMFFDVPLCPCCSARSITDHRCDPDCGRCTNGPFEAVLG